MKIEETKGDLFACDPSASLAHCISEDCRMGKGIATIFKNKFGGVTELKKQVKSGCKTGSVCVLEKEGRYVYYLITKPQVYGKPTYESMKSSLEAMKDHCLQHNVPKICMPKIGCGLDGLQWERVAEILSNVFESTDIDITVYYL